MTVPSTCRKSGAVMRRRLRARRGVNLLEVMVVVVIVVTMLVIAIPLAGSLLGAQQRGAAGELAQVYELLQDEAQLQNVTLRVAFHLDDNYYEVEVGSPDTLVFTDPDRRLEHEKEVADKLARQPKRADADEDQMGDDGQALDVKRFAKLQSRFLKTFELPSGTRFGGVYTPQYGDYQRPQDPDDFDPDEKRIAYSYIFPSGYVEHTVVLLVPDGDDESGFTLEVEPMSGNVTIDRELRDWDDNIRLLPERGPELES